MGFIIFHVCFSYDSSDLTFLLQNIFEKKILKDYTMWGIIEYVYQRNFVIKSSPTENIFQIPKLANSFEL